MYKIDKNIITLFVPLILFYVGWIKFATPGYGPYYVDYGIRFLMIALIWRERSVLLTKPSWPKLSLWGIFSAVLIVYIISNHVIYSYDVVNDMNELLYKTSNYPRIEDMVLLSFDMTIGLALVAITEEFIFRYKLNEFLEGWQVSLPLRYLVSALLFCLIHSPQGLISLVETFIWGIVLFYLYQKSRSLHFVVVIHFITNFVVFGLFALGQ